MSNVSTCYKTDAEGTSGKRHDLSIDAARALLGTDRLTESELLGSEHSAFMHFGTGRINLQDARIAESIDEPLSGRPCLLVSLGDLLAREDLTDDEISFAMNPALSESVHAALKRRTPHWNPADLQGLGSSSTDAETLSRAFFRWGIMKAPKTNDTLCVSKDLAEAVTKQLGRIILSGAVEVSDIRNEIGKLLGRAEEEVITKSLSSLAISAKAKTTETTETTEANDERPLSPTLFRRTIAEDEGTTWEHGTLRPRAKERDALAKTEVFFSQFITLPTTGNDLAGVMVEWHRGPYLAGTEPSVAEKPSRKEVQPVMLARADNGYYCQNSSPFYFAKLHDGFS